jgi:hypothetical protein
MPAGEIKKFIINVRARKKIYFISRIFLATKSTLFTNTKIYLYLPFPCRLFFVASPSVPERLFFVIAMQSIPSPTKVGADL